jgi:hypothetical protein
LKRRRSSSAAASNVTFSIVPLAAAREKQRQRLRVGLGLRWGGGAYRWGRQASAAGPWRRWRGRWCAGRAFGGGGEEQQAGRRVCFGFGF